MTIKHKYGISLLIISLFSTIYVRAQVTEYILEVGAQGGLGYYVGDVTDHIFNNVQAAYGLQFRYKITPRWALQAKVQRQRLKMPDAHYTEDLILEPYIYNTLWSADVVVEFNFFRFGAKQYDERIRQITPYIFLGFGGSEGEGWKGGGFYIPVGIGMKWKFAKHWTMTLAWQQQIYFTDDLENKKRMDNPKGLNGSNILNNDFTSNLTLGIVFEFAQAKKPCRLCE